MNYDKIYEVKINLSKEEFIRKVLFQLSQYSNKLFEPKGIINNNVVNMLDISKFEFKDFKVKYNEIIKCNAHLELDVEATIGYNNEIKHYDGTNQYFHSEHKRSSFMTTWNPLQKFHVSSDAIVYAYNKTKSERKNSENIVDEDLKQYLNNISEKNLKEIDLNKMTVNSDVYNEIEETAALEAIVNDSPGDCIEDTIYEGKIDTELTCLLVPYYEVTFLYDNREYSALVYTNEYEENDLLVYNNNKKYTCELVIGIREFVHYIFKVTKNNEDINKLLKDKHKEEYKLYSLIDKIKWIIIAVLVIIVCLVIQKEGIYTLISLSLIGLGIGTTIFKKKFIEKLIEKKEKDEITKFIDERLEQLNNKLLSNNCKFLSNDEKQTIKDNIMNIFKINDKK